MEYPVFIKVIKTKKVYEAVNFLELSNCYDCRSKKGKRELISACDVPVLYSRDKKEWLTFDELIERDYHKVELDEKAQKIADNLCKALDYAFQMASKEEELKK